MVQTIPSPVAASRGPKLQHALVALWFEYYAHCIYNSGGEEYGKSLRMRLVPGNKGLYTDYEFGYLEALLYSKSTYLIPFNCLNYLLGGSISDCHYYLLFSSRYFPPHCVMLSRKLHVSLAICIHQLFLLLICAPLYERFAPLYD